MIGIFARLPLVISRDGKWYVASCPLLDVHSQGRTVQKAKKNLKEALSLFFESCIERNTLDAALRECGFVLGAPKKAGQEYVEVPIPFLPTKPASTSRQFAVC